MNTPQFIGFRSLPMPLLNPIYGTGNVAVFWSRVYWMIPLPHLVFVAFLAVSGFGGPFLFAAALCGVGIEAVFLVRMRLRPLTVSTSGAVSFTSMWKRITINDSEAVSFYWRRIVGNFAVSRLVIVDASTSPAKLFRVSGFGVWWPHIPQFSRDLERYGLTQVD